MKKILYLDWNVVKGIQNPTEEAFKILISFITENRENLLIPYSSSHLNDLNKEYEKNKAYIDSDLLYLEQLSQNVAIAKYFGEENERVHNRNIFEFFESIRKDSFSPENAGNTLAEMGNMIGLMQQENDIDMSSLCDDNEHNNEVRGMFPSFFEKANFSNLLKDVFGQIANVNNNPTLFNEVRKKTISHFDIDTNMSNWNNSVLDKLNCHIDDKLGDSSMKIIQNLINPPNQTFYDKYTMSYQLLGFWGFRSETLNKKNKFNNAIEDAVHSFYGACSNCFITNDDIVYQRTKALFESFEISTQLIKIPSSKNGDMNKFKIDLENIFNS